MKKNGNTWWIMVVAFVLIFGYPLYQIALLTIEQVGRWIEHIKSVL